MNLRRLGRVAVVVVVLGLLVAALWMLAAPEGRGAGGRRSRGGRGRPAAAVDDRPLGVVGRVVDAAGIPDVSGRVEDSDGLPVDDGRLILHCLADAGGVRYPPAGHAVELGAGGEFRGPGCRGVLCVELVHAGLIPEAPWVLRPGEPAVLVARPLGRREGQVVDPQGRPVAGAQISIRPPPGERDPTALPPFTSRSATTDAEGHFAFARIERPPCDPCGEASGRCSTDDEREVPTYGSAVLVARARGFRGVEVTIELDEDVPWRVVMAAPAPAVSGVLVDPAGVPYARARILARSQVRSYEVHQAAVGEGGVFELAELGDGEYEVRALQDGVELASRTGVRAGEVLELRGSGAAEGVAVTVVVIGGDGGALAGAAVEGGPFGGAKTDAYGRVEASQVLPGEYALYIRPPGQAPQREVVTIREGGGEVRVELDAPRGRE